jgi:hypothetical protein
MVTLSWRSGLFRAAVVFVATWVGLLIAPALAAGSGTALGVNPQARAERAAEVFTLSVGADIFIGDRIVTSDRGLVQIQFDDDTRLVVGPNSAMVLEDYLLRGNSTPGQFAINALSGTFRFVTGDAEKDRYVIKTPTGTLGVRGTSFDFFVEALLTSVLSYHGSVVMCSTTNVCTVLENTCEVGQVQRAESRTLGIGRMAEGVDAEFFRETFQLSVSQTRLLRPFRISNALSCSRRGVSGPPAALVSETVQTIGEPPVVQPPPEEPKPEEPKPPKPPKPQKPLPPGHQKHDHHKHKDHPKFGHGS